MDDNLTQIVLAAFALATVVATGVISIISLRVSQRAVETSKANAVTLASVEHKVDGITSERVQRESDLGDAKAEIARGAGRDEERDKQAAIAAAVPVPVVPLGPVEVSIVGSDVTVPVKIEEKKP